MTSCECDVWDFVIFWAKHSSRKRRLHCPDAQQHLQALSLKSAVLECRSLWGGPMHEMTVLRPHEAIPSGTNIDTGFGRRKFQYLFAAK
jgi:hypothetical protein